MIAALSTFGIIPLSKWSDCLSVILSRSLASSYEQIGNYKMPDEVRLPNEIQGGAFFKGDLYLATNIETAVWKVCHLGAKIDT
jgi:hypothetical protein